MQRSLKTVFFLLIGALFISGCGKINGNSGDKAITIQLNKTQSIEEELSLASQFFKNSFGVFTTPTTINDFSCFGINVTGAGIVPLGNFDGCTTSTNFHGKGMGILSDGPVSRGQSIQLAVPAGPSRNFDIYGLYPGGGSCHGTSNSIPGQPDYGYYIGGAVANVENENTTVAINISYSGQTHEIECTNTQQGYPVPFAGTPGYASLNMNSTTAAGSVTGTAINVSNVSTRDGTLQTTQGASSTYPAIAEYIFDISAYGSVTAYPNIRVTWAGNTGTDSVACGSFTAGGSTVSIATSVSTWATMATISPYTDTQVSTSISTSGVYVNGSSIYIRVKSNTGLCAGVNTDYISVQLEN